MARRAQEHAQGVHPEIGDGTTGEVFRRAVMALYRALRAHITGPIQPWRPTPPEPRETRNP